MKSMEASAMAARNGIAVDCEPAENPVGMGGIIDPVLTIIVNDGEKDAEWKLDPEGALQMREILDNFISFAREKGYLIVE